MKNRTLLGSVLILAIAATAPASNTGFSILATLSAARDACSTNLISTPYLYYPNGKVATPQFAHDLVIAFPSATSFARVDPNTGLFETWENRGGKWMGIDFPLAEGLGLAISVPADTTARIVGSHDNTFSGVLLRAALPGQTTHLVAPPYHSQWNNSDDLLNALFDGTHRLSVATWRGGTLIERTVDAGPTWSGTKFDLVVQEALLLTVTADTLFLSTHWFHEGTLEIAAPAAPASLVPRSGTLRRAVPAASPRLCPTAMLRATASGTWNPGVVGSGSSEP